MPELTPTVLFNLLTGVLMLVSGRRLFWLFVGLIGFLVGFSLTPQLIPSLPEWIFLLIAVTVGLLGAFLAVILQRLAVGIAGFLTGGYLVNHLLIVLGIDTTSIWGITYLIGGVIGFGLTLAFLDLALILLSSLVGALLIAQALAFPSPLGILIYILLVVVGAAIQAGWMRIHQPPTRRRVK